jgi:RNA polymerase sigma-70 factor (ECF subfamily)
MPDTIDFTLLAKLATEAQSGDARACESLLENLYTYVHRVLTARLGRFADLDDLTQECLLGMHKSLLSYHPSRNIKPWVHAIIRYKTADHFRAIARRRESEFNDGIADPADPSTHPREPGGNGMPDPAEIRALLNTLPSPLKSAIVLTKFDGLSCEEAARREDVTPTALRKRISRGYRELAGAIERKLEVESDAR